MSLEELALRQLDANFVFPFTYTGNLAPESMKFRLYNDTNKTRKIEYVRASVGGAPTGAGIIVDINKNDVSIFNEAINPANPPPASYPRVYIGVGANTGTSTPKPESLWLQGEYLTVAIDQIGSTFAGADLTINVVVSE